MKINTNNSNRIFPNLSFTFPVLCCSYYCSRMNVCKKKKMIICVTSTEIKNKNCFIKCLLHLLCEYLQLLNRVLQHLINLSYLTAVF